MVDYENPIKIDIERTFYDNATEQFVEFGKANDDIIRLEDLIKTSNDEAEIKSAKKDLKRLQRRKETDEVDYIFHVAKMLKYYGDEINEEQSNNSLDSFPVEIPSQDHKKVSSYDQYETFEDPVWNSSQSIPDTDSSSDENLSGDGSGDINISSFFAKSDTVMIPKKIEDTNSQKTFKKGSKKRKTVSEPQPISGEKKKVKLFSYILNKRMSNSKHHIDDDEDHKNEFRRHDFYESDSLDGMNFFQRAHSIDSDTIQVEKDNGKFLKPIISKEGREVCPDCPGEVILRMNDKPPSLNCPRCGISFDLFDTSLENLVERENLLQKKQDYQPKSHFRIWLGKITNEKTKQIPQEIYDEYYKLLYENKIYDLDEVNWDIIKEYTKILTKRNPAKFKEYSDHVYQITNTIRKKPAVQLSEEQKRDVLEYYDEINVFWKDNKDSFDIKRHNAMYNALTLQVIFIFLKYPASVIRNFNMIKGGSNKEFYNKMIKKMCEYFKKEPFYIEHIEMIKNENISISEKMKQIEEQNNNMESSAFDFSSMSGFVVKKEVTPVVVENALVETKKEIPKVPVVVKEESFDLGDFFM